VKLAPNSRINRSTTGACTCTTDVVSVSLFVPVIAFQGSFDAVGRPSFLQHREPADDGNRGEGP
jgi:hypothetical protein